MAEKKAFNWRNFTSFMITAAFLVSVVSGIVLYIVPEGRIAYWVDWDLLGLDKTGWAELHIVFALVFLIGGIFHLFVYNWVSFKAYLTKRISGKLDYRKPRKEMVSALVLSVALVTFSIGGWQPVSALFDLNAAAKAAWVTSPDLEPPFGHAEDSSLVGLTRKMNIDLEPAMAALKDKGFRVDSQKQKLVEIAHANGVTPMDVYQIIKPFEKKPETEEFASMTAEDVEVRFGGSGIGPKKLTDIAAMVGVPLDVAKKRLSGAGMESDGDLSLKEIAKAKDLSPMDVLKVILVEGHKI